MPNHAHASILGHAGRDAETRYTSGGDAVTEVSVAVTRKRKMEEQVTWWRVVVFGKPAEWAGEIKKGDVVMAAGEPALEEWTDKDGGKRFTLRLYANNITGFGKWQKTEKQEKPQAGGFSDMEEDIPF